jgi:hypothetical protein
MKKEIYLIKGEKDESYDQFSQRMLSIGNALSQDNEVRQLKLNYTLKPPPKFSVIPFKNEKIAAISIYTINKPNSNLLANEMGFSGAYLVEEAIPVAYNKTWDDKNATPGVCLLTLFRQKKGIDYATFIHRWHNGHTPLSLKLHPLWNYNRNVVKENVIETSYKWDGIVEEHFRTSADLLNPVKFFGNPFTMIYHMIQVYFDTKSFLDYKTIEPYFTTEIYIKS